MSEFDAIVIGTGQAGPSLVGRLTDAGMKVAVIERAKFGGTCVNTGCTPTKTLVASAYAAHLARRAADLGVTFEGVSVDMKRVKARKDFVSARSSGGLENWLRGIERCTVYQGHAQFTSAREVQVNGERLRAERIFINVGGRALAPAIPGLDQVGYLNNSSLLDLDTVPPHLVILGGSYIGLEFAQIFRRFGSEVTVIEAAPRLAPREDADVSAAIADILGNEGVSVHLDTKCLTVARASNGVALTVEHSGDVTELHGTHLLLAVGRRPNTDDLGLAQAGVETDQRGYIKVDDQLRTNIPGIWALGDCNGRGAFTHTAYNDFEIVAANLIDNDQRRVSDRIAAYNLYIDPPLGRVGMTEAEARRSGRRALKADLPMERVSRAFEKGETQGFMRVIVDQDTKEILGASILGVSGDEIVHTILALMYARAPYTVLQRAMHIHPTVSELLPTMMGQLRPL
jgi:pyruvate/2-oxoglutarate dehydrogenase complex dihydrolipoamide dehydrogenase (E3) component